MRRTLSSNRRKTVMAVVMVALVLALCEVGARIAGPQSPVLKGHEGGSLLTGHPTRLWTMAPGVQRNAGATATVGALGLRGDVPQGVRGEEERVMVVGDSTFFGHGVKDDETLSVQLGQRLTAAGVDAAVINGAMLGYSTEQTRVWLDEEGWSLEPTLLLVGNLWSDNNWDLFRDKDLVRTAAHYRLSPWARSHFVRLVAGAIDRMRGGTGARLITWTQRSEWPAERVRRVDIERYAQNLDHFVRSAAARGTGVAFIAPVNRDMLRKRRPGERFSWGVYFEAMRAVAAHHGVPVIDAAPAMEALVHGAEQAGSVDPMAAAFIDKMHPTAEANRRVSGLVWDALREAGWPQTRLVGRAETAVSTESLPTDSWGRQPGNASEHASPHMRLF